MFFIALPSLFGLSPQLQGSIDSSAYAIPVAGKRCVVENETLSSACLADLRTTRIAVVKNFFTSTAYFGQSYSKDSKEYGNFYTFYAKYGGIPNGSWVTNTTDLNWLKVKLVRSWDYSQSLKDFITEEESSEKLNSSNVAFLNDSSVSSGALFATRTGGVLERKYDVAVIGFAEYVTAAEYDAYRTFVAAGGKLVIAGSSTFVALVNYTSPSATGRGTVTFLDGHGWYFNGTAAQKTNVYVNLLDNLNANWVGSYLTMCCGSGYRVKGAVANTSDVLSEVLRDAYGNGSLMKAYYAHEEDGMTNASDIPIAYWNVTHLDGRPHVAIYRHDYGRGEVVDTGIFATDILEYNREIRFFLLVSMVPSSLLYS